MKKMSMAVLGSYLALLTVPVWSVQAQADTSPNTIHVLVYQDVNEDGQLDPSDFGVDEVEVFAGSAAAEFAAVTDAEGWAWLPATAGEWSVSVRTPAGYELVSLEPVLVVFDQPGDQEQTVHIGLRQTTTPDSDSEPVQEEAGTPTAEPEVSVTETVDPDETQDGDADDPDDLPVLLPESGAPIHPLLLVGFGSGLVLVFGLVMIAAGRRLQR